MDIDYYKRIVYKKNTYHKLFCDQQNSNLIVMCWGCGSRCVDYTDMSVIKGKCKCKDCIYNFKSYKMYNINISFCYKCNRKILFDL